MKGAVVHPMWYWLGVPPEDDLDFAVVWVPPTVHRLGRWYLDPAMTAGSAVLFARFVCRSPSLTAAQKRSTFEIQEPREWALLVARAH